MNPRIAILDAEQAYRGTAAQPVLAAVRVRVDALPDGWDRRAVRDFAEGLQGATGDNPEAMSRAVMVWVQRLGL